MRTRRVEFDAYNRQFRAMEEFGRDRDDVDHFVIPDFSSEELPIPDDLDFEGDELFFTEK